MNKDELDLISEVLSESIPEDPENLGIRINSASPSLKPVLMRYVDVKVELLKLQQSALADKREEAANTLKLLDIRISVAEKRISEEGADGLVSDPSTCVHHFIIEPANGPISIGVCYKCLIAKDHNNYIEGAGWGGDPKPEPEPEPEPPSTDGGSSNVSNADNINLHDDSNN